MNCRLLINIIVLVIETLVVMPEMFGRTTHGFRGSVGRCGGSSDCWGNGGS